MVIPFIFVFGYAVIVGQPVSPELYPQVYTEQYLGKLYVYLGRYACFTVSPDFVFLIWLFMGGSRLTYLCFMLKPICYICCSVYYLPGVMDAIKRILLGLSESGGFVALRFWSRYPFGGTVYYTNCEYIHCHRIYNSIYAFQIKETIV